MASKRERESLFCDSQFNKTALLALYTQRQSSTFCDVIMRICGKELYAHSSVLAAASPYFSVFLSQDLPRQFSQRSPQIIEIQIEGSFPDNLYEDALESIIDYVYTGKLKVRTSTAFQIIEIARIMQMTNVVMFLEAYLQGKIPNLGGDSETVVSSPPCVFHNASTNTDESFLKPKVIEKTKFQTCKYVSVSTLVNPQLLGLESIRREKKDEKTQTNVKDFQSRTGRPRGRPRKDARRENAAVNVDAETLESNAEELENGTVEEVQAENDGESFEEENMGLEDVDADNEMHDASEVENEKSLTGDADVEDQSYVAESAASVLESKDNEVVIEISPIPNKEESPTKSGTRRSSRKFKPTIKLREASRNMLIDKPTADQEYVQSADDDDDDVIISSPAKSLKRKRGRPSLAKVKDEPFVTKELLKAEQLITKLTEQEQLEHTRKESNEDSNAAEEQEAEVEYQNDEMMEDEPIEEENAEESDSGPVEVSDPKIIKKEKRKRSDENEAENKATRSGPKSVSRAGRVRRVSVAAVNALKKKSTSNKYVCHAEKCEFFTNSVREMSNHQKLHKLEQNICYYCEDYFEERVDLIAHLEKHKGPMPFYCPVCDVRFKSRTQMSLHLPKHSDTKPYKCEVCDARFKWKHAVKNHMVVHSNKKDHLCDICGYATAHKSQLKAHRLIHTGNTFKCTVDGCNFQATKRQNLKYHMFCHTQEKPHQCEVCGQNFSLIKNLRRHMLLHSAASKHSCERCEFNTTRFDKLKEHMLRQHAVGTPPEKRVKVSELVMQNFVGTSDEASAAGLMVRSGAELNNDSNVQTDIPVGTEIHAVVTGDVSAVEGAAEGTTFSITTAAQSGQHIEYLEIPNETIIIQSIEGGDEEQIALPIVTSDGTTIHAAEVEESQEKDSESLGYTEIMIPVSQISDFVQHVTYVSQ